MTSQFNEIDHLKEIESFKWEETYMIDEIPKGDIWINFATTKKLKLEERYRNLNMPKECSKHFMAHNPDISDNLKTYLEPFKNTVYHYNFLKLTPGYNLWWHYDSYSTFVKFNNIQEYQEESIKRTIIMFTTWSKGQVLQIDTNTHVGWKVGDKFSWHSSTWHGVGNFSFNDFIVMQITWIDQ